MSIPTTTGVASLASILGSMEIVGEGGGGRGVGR